MSPPDTADVAAIRDDLSAARRIEAIDMALLGAWLGTAATCRWLEGRTTTATFFAAGFVLGVGAGIASAVRHRRLDDLRLAGPPDALAAHYRSRLRAMIVAMKPGRALLVVYALITALLLVVVVDGLLDETKPS